MKKEQEKDQEEVFDQLKKSLLVVDPVYFAETYLTLDGKPFRIHGNGYRPFAEIYRYIGIKALEQDSKPILLLKSRQTGGTTTAAALQLYFMCSGLFGNGNNSPIRVIHAFPHEGHAQRYTREKLNPMIRLAAPSDKIDKKGQIKSYIQNLLDTTSDSNDSLSFKQFHGGNFIRIDSTGLDGGRLRGSTADVIFFDEVQDITGEAIGNCIEMLKQAKYGSVPNGVQFYFGTPKKKGSDFNKMWNASSQQYYYLGCEKCKEYFPLYTMGSDEWEKIWIHGFIVKCPHCGFEQDKREAAERGKWVATTDINDPSCKFVGFHINQCYMPHIRREDIEAERPGVHPINTERKFRNEVLGEFHHGETSPITAEEIINSCGERERKMRARINPGDEQIVVMGIDYGARADLEQIANPEKRDIGGQSFTVATIMSVKGPKLFSIDFALRFKRNDPESKKGIIDTLMRQYSVNLVVGDIGYSNDFSMTMQNTYGDKYLVSRAAPKINDKIKFEKDRFPKEIGFERDYYIAELYELLKNGQIKFPLGDYDKIAWLIEHCTSMELKPSLSKFGGDPVMHYIKGSTPNDGLMSLLNAYIAYKFLITQGFTVKNPYLQQQSFDQKSKPLATIGYISKRI